MDAWLDDGREAAVTDDDDQSPAGVQPLARVRCGRIKFTSGPLTTRIQALDSGSPRQMTFRFGHSHTGPALSSSGLSHASA